MAMYHTIMGKLNLHKNNNDSDNEIAGVICTNTIINTSYEEDSDNEIIEVIHDNTMEAIIEDDNSDDEITGVINDNEV